jgi:hypothetical protein
LIYGEHSELAREILDTSQCTNLAQRVRDFGRFEMNKCDLGRQREDRILAAEEGIPYETHESLPAVILINVWVPVFYLRLITFKTALKKFVNSESSRLFGHLALKLAL